MRSDPDVTEVIEIAPSAEINSVDPEPEVLDLVANTVGMKGKNVSARATVKLIPAMSREQDVIPCTALQLVVAGEAKDDVIPAGAGVPVVPRSAGPSDTDVAKIPA